MYDLITIGNISIDLFFKGESLTFENDRFQLAVGGKYFVDELYSSLGGGGSNVAIGAVRNGLTAAVFGKIGNNSFKESILKELETAGVSNSLCQFKDNYLNISSVLLTRTGERSIVHFEPPNEKLFETQEDYSKILQTKAVYLGNLPDISIEERSNAAHFIKQNKIFLILNLGVNDCKRTFDELFLLLHNADVLILNSHEFADLIKKPYDQIDFKQDLQKDLTILQNKVLVVTDGAKGSYGYDDGQVFYQTATEPEKILDTTGAGDGYVAAYIAEYMRSKSTKEAMRRGAEYAANILAKIGAN